MADENAVEVKVKVPQVNDRGDGNGPEGEDEVPCAVNNWDKPFGRSMFSGMGGSVSSARVNMTLLIVASIGWVTYLVIVKKDFPSFEGLTLFIATTVAVVYGPGKIGQMIAAGKR